VIGRVAGRIVHRGDDHVVIDAHGVGYVVQVSARTLAALPGEGEAAALWTELLVREDALTLVGFPTLHEKEWHRLLMTVQGVGAKAAMSILGTLGPEALARSLALGDWNAIKAAPGIGPKTAQRVAMELKDKAPAMMALRPAAPAAPAAAVAEASPRPTPARAAPAAAAEALSALANLGYAPGEAAAAVAEASGALPQAGTPELIRAALRLLAPKP
jgi:Holliday junction DNA helicase RuvA